MRYRDLTEAPIADFGYIDKSNEIDDFSFRPGGKVGSSFQPADQRALASTKWRAKLIQTFRNTPEPINFYAFNAKIIQIHTQNSGSGIDGRGQRQDPELVIPDYLDGMSDWAGTHHPEDFKINFGFLPPNYQTSINIMLLQNEGDERVGMSPWIAAHRIIHALISEETISNDNFRRTGSQAFRSAQSMVRRIEDAWHDSHDTHALNSKFETPDKVSARNQMFAATATMASARNHKIARPGEFIIELFTQYFLTGDFTINLDWIDPRKTSDSEVERILSFANEVKQGLNRMFEEAVGELIVF